MGFVWLVLPALPLLLRLLLLGLPGAPAPRPRSHSPARPSPLRGGWRAGARSRPALGTRRGCSAACGRRVRARAQRRKRRAALARRRSLRSRRLFRGKYAAPIRKVVQSLTYHVQAVSGILKTRPKGKDTRKEFAISLRKKTKESRPFGRLSPYLDTIGDYLRKRSCRKFAFVAQSKGNLLPLSSYCAFFRTKPLAIAGEIWYNDSGKVSSP